MGNLLRRLLRWLSGRPDKVMYIGGSDVLPAPLRPEDAAAAPAGGGGVDQPAGAGGAAGPADADRAEPAAGGVYRPAV